MRINDVRVFNNENNVRLDFIGTKGIKESVTASQIKPVLNKVHMYNHIGLSAVLGYTTAETTADADDAVAVTFNIDDGDGSPPYSSSLLAKDVFINRRVYKADGTFLGECTNAVWNSGSNVTLTFDDGIVNTVADNTQLAVKPLLDYRPATAFADGDDYLSYNNAITVTEDSAFSSFAAGTYGGDYIDITITLDTNIATTVDTNLHNQVFTLTSLDGRIKKYKFDSTEALTASGTTVATDTLKVGIIDSGDGGAVSVDDICSSMKWAIEHPNGHGGRVVCSLEGSGVLRIKTLVKPFNEYFEENDYLSFSEYNTEYTSRHNFEIMQISHIDTVSNKIYLKRNCFGTKGNALATATTYLVWSNRIDINEEQFRTNSGIVTLTDWSNYSGNNINGSSVYLNDIGFGGGTAYTRNRGVIDTSSDSVQYVDKTITINSITNIGDFLYSEGDIITLYQSGTTANNGYRGKILKKAIDTGRLVLTMDTAVNLNEV